MSAPPATAGPAQPDPASAQLTKKPDQKKTPVFTTKVNSGNTTHHSKIGDPALPMRGKQPPHSKKPAPELQPAPPIKGVAAAVSEGYSAKPPPPPARKGDGVKKRATIPKPPLPVARLIAPAVKPEPVRPRAAGDIFDDEFGAVRAEPRDETLTRDHAVHARAFEKSGFKLWCLYQSSDPLEILVPVLNCMHRCIRSPHISGEPTSDHQKRSDIARSMSISIEPHVSIHLILHLESSLMHISITLICAQFATLHTNLKIDFCILSVPKMGIDEMFLDFFKPLQLPCCSGDLTTSSCNPPRIYDG
jgi:hypothetical protein